MIAAFVVIDTMMEHLGHRSDVRAQIPDSEILTIAVAAAKYFGNHYERTVQIMNGCRFRIERIGVSHFHRCLHQRADWMVWISEVLGEVFTTGDGFVVDSLPLPMCRQALPEGAHERLLRVVRCQTRDVLWIARASSSPTETAVHSLSDTASGVARPDSRAFIGGWSARWGAVVGRLRGKHTTAIQNRVKPFFILVLSQCS